MRQKANAWERRRVAYKVNCCCSLAGNKIFVERHLQSHFQAQCAFKVMRSTCPFSALPSPPPSLTLSLSLSSLCQAVVLVFIAYIFGVFFFVFLLLLLLLATPAKRLPFYGLISACICRHTLKPHQTEGQGQLQEGTAPLRTEGACRVWNTCFHLKTRKYFAIA